MSLTSSLQRIVQAKADIKTAIENKGVTVGDDVSIANYDDYIDAIQTGSSTPTQTKTVALSMASGDQVISPDTGYALSQVTVEKPSTLTAENIKSGVSIGGVTGSYAGSSPTLITKSITANGTYNASSDNADGYSQVTVNVSGGGGQDYDKLKGIVDGSITEFVMPSGMTTIAENRFTGMTYLSSIDLTGCTTIGNNAFRRCSGLDSTKTITIPSSVTSIGNYAFGDGVTAQMVLKPTNLAVGTAAFQDCTGLTEVDGTFSSIGNTAFDYCTGLTKIHLQNSTGTLGETAFSNCGSVTDVDISDTTFTSIGTRAFQGINMQSSSISYSYMLTFDFRKGTFTSIPTYLFSYSSSSRSYYFRAFFPSTITTINASAFRYNRYFHTYFLNAVPPTMANNNAYGNTTSYEPKIFVPYNSINAYKTASNWSIYASYIYGWAEENTFSLGDTLPSTNTEGLTLTWYDGVPNINGFVVTTVADPTKIHYCVAS